jgi:hypothetical protein
MSAAGQQLSQRMPESVRQLGAAARSGNLVRVAGIQAQNAWMRFGAIAVALGCAGASYTTWRIVERAMELFGRLRENHLALTIAVRPARHAAVHCRAWPNLGELITSSLGSTAKLKSEAESARWLMSCPVLLQGGGAACGVAGIVAFRQQFLARPAQVHALAMRLLREDPAVAEVLRLPLAAGRGPVASVVTGGHVWFKVRRLSGPRLPP